MSNMQERWGHETMHYGFTGVPNLLLRINTLEETKGSERITPAEMFVLIVILGHWINHRLQPYPSIERISRYTSLSSRHVRRMVHTLVAKNYLTIHRHGELSKGWNSYSPRPIVDKLNAAAGRLTLAIDESFVDETATRLEIADRLGFFPPPARKSRRTRFD